MTRQNLTAESELTLALMAQERWWHLDPPAAGFWQDLQRAIASHPLGKPAANIPDGVIGRPSALPALIHHRNALARLCGVPTTEVQRQRLAYHAGWLLCLLRSGGKRPTGGPLVSVVIPVFNRTDTIAEAVACCLAQTHVHLEILVVDDGSTEDITAALQPVLDRIRLLRQTPNRGAGAARNLGISEARGQLVHFLDADDLLEPDAIARKLDALVAIPDADLVFSGARQTGLGLHEREEHLRFLEPPNGDADCPTTDLLGVMLRRYPFLTSTVLVARHRLSDLGLFDPALRHHEDTELFFRLALRQLRVIGITGLATHRRVTGRSLSAAQTPDAENARFRARCLIALAAEPRHWTRCSPTLLKGIFRVELFTALALESGAALPQCRRALLRGLRQIRNGAAGAAAASRLQIELRRALQSLKTQAPSLAACAFYQALESITDVEQPRLMP